MGSGAVSFAMAERCKYVIANDNDDEVFNLFMVWKYRKDELIEAVSAMPYHQSLWQFWKTHTEADPVWRAARFLMLSNYGYMGKPETMRFGSNNAKHLLISLLSTEPLMHIQYLHHDFRNVIDSLFFHRQTEKSSAFIFADPPYLSSDHNYQSGFAEADSRDLFAVLTSSGIRFAMSEFRHPFILEQAAHYGLHITSLGERRTLGNRQEEILVTNYNPLQKQAALFEKEHYATLPN